MPKINCPFCTNPDAEVRTTKQKTDAKRKVTPKAFLHCPECGSLFSNKVSFSNRISAMLSISQAQADLSDKQSDKPPISSDNTPPQKGGFFKNWSTVL
jgi:uncharacterized Zn finger protein